MMNIVQLLFFGFYSGANTTPAVGLEEHIKLTWDPEKRATEWTPECRDTEWLPKKRRPQ